MENIDKELENIRKEKEKRKKMKDSSKKVEKSHENKGKTIKTINNNRVGEKERQMQEQA